MSASQSKRRVSNGAAFMIAVMVPITIYLLIQLFDDPAVFLTTILKSLAMGSTYAIIALGFVLIFKATEVVNFSQGALAMIGALFISFLVADETIPSSRGGATATLCRSATRSTTSGCRHGWPGGCRSSRPSSSPP